MIMIFFKCHIMAIFIAEALPRAIDFAFVGLMAQLVGIVKGYERNVPGTSGRFCFIYLISPGCDPVMGDNRVKQ
jgi:hypothetical protein